MVPGPTRRDTRLLSEINAFAFYLFNQSTVFVVTPTYGSRGVLKSIDGGTTWSVVTHNLPHMPVRDIILTLM